MDESDPGVVVRRDPVAVICPFAGTVDEAREIAGHLARITSADDEPVLVDNTSTGLLQGLEAGPVRIVSAPEERSSYYARNVGVEATSSEWLLFVDADCVPTDGILELYFGEDIPAECGAVAGGIVGAPSQPGLLANWARARGVLDQERLYSKDRPFAATANLLVRRAAWLSIGGFAEGIRSGGDVDFSWRLQAAGWKLDYRGAALVEHVHRTRLRPLVRQYARYGAGRSWLERRYPEEPRSSKHLAFLLAAPLLIVGNLLRGRRELGAFRAVDTAAAVGSLLGRPLGNRASRIHDQSTETVVLVTDRFPEAGTLRAIVDGGTSDRGVAVEAIRRAHGAMPADVRGIAATYLEDDGRLARLGDALWLALRFPSRTVRGAREAGIRELIRLAPQARRIAGRRSVVVRFRQDDPQAAASARRICAILGLKCESVEDPR